MKTAASRKFWKNIGNVKKRYSYRLSYLMVFFISLLVPEYSLWNSSTWCEGKKCKTKFSSEGYSVYISRTLNPICHFIESFLYT